MPAPRLIAVLGMHGAGTSLCCEILGHLGVDFGGDLKAGLLNYNPRGFHESVALLGQRNLVFDRLERTGRDPATLSPLPAEWWREPELAPVRRTLAEILSQRLAGGPRPVGFKDPVTTRLLPLWNLVFADLSITPAFVIAVRDPRAVARSTERRFGMPARLTELLWLEHYVDALTGGGRHVRAIVHYEDWFADPIAQADRLADGLGLVPPSADAARAERIRSCIRPDLDHAGAPTGATVYRLTDAVHAWLRRPEPATLPALLEACQAGLQLARSAVELAGTPGADAAATAAWKRRNRQLAKERDRAGRLAAELARERDALLASTSWKITAPLRAARRALWRR